MDYRSIGYRECIHEMISYLAHGEGLGPANPLHTRLVSHLYQQVSSLDQSPQTPPHNYCSVPAVDRSLPVYSNSPNTCYPEHITVCKPEPPVSPSYCSAGAGGPASDYDTYARYNADCSFSSIPNTVNTQWSPSMSANTPINCQNPPTQYPFATQSSWV